MDEIKSIPGLMIQRDGSYALTIECPNGIMTPAIIETISKISKDMGIITHITTAQKIMLLGLDQKTGQKAIELLEKAGSSIRKARDISQPRICVGSHIARSPCRRPFHWAHISTKSLRGCPFRQN